MRPKIVLYYSYENMIGGPQTYIRAILDSEMANKYVFETCYQNCSPKGVNIRLLIRMVRRIRDMRPDIVHVQGLQSEGFYGVLAARLAGCHNILVTVHGFASDNLNSPFIKRVLYKYFVEPITLRLSTKAFCVCKFAADRKEFCKHLSKKQNSEYIHNPIPCLESIETREQIRNRYGIGPCEKVFVMSGRVTKDKGFHILSEAIKKINREENYNFRVFILGDGVYLESLRQQLSSEIKNEQVYIIGHTDRVFDFLLASDIFVFPSLHENFPMSILEACEAGLPCITSNVGGIPEIVQNNYNGLVVSSFDPSDYANAMMTLMSDADLFNYCRNNMNNTRKLFSLDSFCIKMEALYDAFNRNKKEHF